MDFFSTPSPVEELVNKATDPGLLAPDWQTVVQITDMLDGLTPEEVIPVFKLIRKKLGSKNPKVVLLALIIVDSCVKNGDFKVHKVVGSKAFMGAMAALASGKRGADVGAKAAQLVQTWGREFESVKDALPGFAETYRSLQAKGVAFPDTSAQDTIFTPPPSAVARAPAPAAHGGETEIVFSGQGADGGVPPALPPPPPPGMQARRRPKAGGTKLHAALAAAPAPAAAAAAAPSPAVEYATLQAEYDKLDRDLTAVQRRCGTFAQMLLDGANPTTDAWLDEEDFLEQCRSRLHALVQAGSAGTLTEGAFARILDTNDMLVKVLARAHTGTGASNDDLARISAATRHLPASSVDDFDGAGAGAGAGAGDDDDFFGSMGPGAAAPAPASSAASDLAGLFSPAVAAPAPAPAPAPSVPAKATAAANADDPFTQLANRNSGSTIKPKSADEAAALLASLNMGTSATAKPAIAVAAQPPPAPVTAAPSPAPATSASSAVPAPSAEDDDFEAFLDEQAAMFGADTGDSAAASGGNDLSMDELDDILKGSS